MNMPILHEAVSEISSVLQSISITEVTIMVRTLHSGKAEGRDQIQPEMKGHGAMLIQSAYVL